MKTECRFPVALFLTIALIMTRMESTYAQINASTSDIKLQNLLSKTIDVRMTDGSLHFDGTVVTLKPGKTDNSVRLLKIENPDSKRPISLNASKIDEIFFKQSPLDVIYDRKNRCLIQSIEKKIDRLEKIRRATARMETTNDRFWKPLSEDQHQQFLNKHKLFLQRVEDAMPGHPFRLVETEFFLFFTDLTSAEVDGYIVYLDSMYRELCKAFGLSPQRNIWCGKCVVVAFRNEIDFLRFENVVMNVPDAKGAQGLCHQSNDGTVIFAGFKGDNGFFGHVLVHETSHGFVHRYKSTARAPSWLNEGMADWLADKIVKGNSIPRRQLESARWVIQRGGWGDFLLTPRIPGELYGSASSLVAILLEMDEGQQFKQFFDGIKEGKPADESLKDSFGISYQDLRIAYMQRISKLANQKP